MKLILNQTSKNVEGNRAHSSSKSFFEIEMDLVSDISENVMLRRGK